jgi:predicted permease
MLSDLLYRLRALFRRNAVEGELDEELRFHFEQQIEKYVRSGLTRAEAVRQARLTFGGSEQMKAECRDARGVRWLEDLWMDLRYSLRTLRRSPVFLAVAILSLALGIGANSAIFSLIDAVMLRNMPVQEPERLVQFEKIRPEGNRGAFSYQLFTYFREHSQSFTDIFAENKSARPEIAFKGADERVNAELVSGSYHSVLGLEPAAGRLLNPSDDRVPGASPVAVISYRYWKRRFALDPGVIGKSFTLNGSVFTIIGVTPKEFFGTIAGRDPEVTFPLSMARQVTGDDPWRHMTDYFGYNFLNLMARLRPGVSLEQARGDVRGLFESLLREEAGKIEGDARDKNEILHQEVRLLAAATGFNNLRLDFSEPLRVLMCIVALVLLLACANLSSLLLARAAGRQREISVRRAVGAGSGRLARQFLTESLLLALLGGAVGLLLGRWLSSALVAMMANGGTLALPTGYDWRVLVFTGATSLLTCVLVGLAPSLHAAQSNVNPGLKELRIGGRHHLGRALVIAQLAISLLLIVGASQFLGTLAKLYRMDAGFRRAGILTFNVESKQKDPIGRAHTLQIEVLERLNALPGVTSASAAVVLIISGGGWDGSVEVERYTHRPDEDNQANFNYVAPRFFQTMGTPLLLGRDFNERDVSSSKKVAIVNGSFARYYFRDRSPLGQHVNHAEIVGVVKDAKYRNLREPFPKTVYFPLQQLDQPFSEYSYLMHVDAGNPMRLVTQVERSLREIDPTLRVTDTKTFAEHIDRSILNERLLATLGGCFGLLGLVVACLGVFGVMAFQVMRRTNELGVRMALGANRSDIIWLVLREVAMMLLVGSAIGCVAAMTLTRLAKNMLFGLTATDPVLYLMATAILGGATLAAGCFPALRASRVQPMVALRHE